METTCRRFQPGKVPVDRSGLSEIRRDALDLPIRVADRLEAAPALMLAYL